jgi:quercetin dioxygenase-like cupin family protein
MPDSGRYFRADDSTQTEGSGAWVTWMDLDPIEMLPGLRFQPILGDNVMVNMVYLEPNTVAPVHWHEEEQISLVVDGEFEFEVAGEKRIMRRGDAVVIPPNVPHGARTLDGPCLEIDVFHPPRRGLLEAMGIARPD